MQTICVYCAASTQIKPEYFEATARLGKIFAEANLSVVFGGGSSGLGCAKAETDMAKANAVITYFFILLSPCYGVSSYRQNINDPTLINDR